MPDLHFSVEGAEAVPYAVSPLLNFALKIRNASADAATHLIHSITLRCQIRIEPAKRPYEAHEKEKLLDIFGAPSRWGQTLRPMLWTHTSLIVPPFTGQTEVPLPVPCSYDFNLAATKYFDALDAGDIPLVLLFNGTIFHAGPEESLQVEQISWEKEAGFHLPVKVWKDMMQLYYPNSAWLNLHKDTFDALAHFKSQRSLPTWEAALELLLKDNLQGSSASETARRREGVESAPAHGSQR